MIINAFKDKILPMDPDTKPLSENSEEDRFYTSEEDVAPKSKSPNFGSADKLKELLLNTEGDLDFNLINKYFCYYSLRDLLKILDHSRGKSTNKKQVNIINDRLKKLKSDIKNMSEDEIKDKKLNLIVDLVEKILDTKE